MCDKEVCVNCVWWWDGDRRGRLGVLTALVRDWIYKCMKMVAVDEEGCIDGVFRFVPLFSHPINIFFLLMHFFSAFVFFSSPVPHLFGTAGCKSKRVCVCAWIFACACARLNIWKRWQSTKDVALVAYSVSYLFSHPVNILNILSSDASISWVLFFAFFCCVSIWNCSL